MIKEYLKKDKYFISGIIIVLILVHIFQIFPSGNIIIFTILFIPFIYAERWLIKEAIRTYREIKNM
jgi:hypothetical protein